MIKPGDREGFSGFTQIQVWVCGASCRMAWKILHFLESNGVEGLATQETGSRSYGNIRASMAS